MIATAALSAANKSIGETDRKRGLERGLLLLQKFGAGGDVGVAIAKRRKGARGLAGGRLLLGQQPLEHRLLLGKRVAGGGQFLDRLDPLRRHALHLARDPILCVLICD